MLIKWVYEVDPLCCPKCGSQMKIVWFIEPPQAGVIEELLKHCRLCQVSAPRASPDADGLVQEVDSTSSDQLQELTYVDMDTLLDTLKSSPTHVALRLNCGVHPCFVCIELQFVLK